MLKVFTPEPSEMSPIGRFGLECHNNGGNTIVAGLRPDPVAAARRLQEILDLDKAGVRDSVPQVPEPEPRVIPQMEVRGIAPQFRILPSPRPEDSVPRATVIVVNGKAKIRLLSEAQTRATQTGTGGGMGNRWASRRA